MYDRRQVLLKLINNMHNLIVSLEQQRYIPGDIGRIKPTGAGSKAASWLMNRVLTPHTDYFHHFVIRTYIPDEKDYEILEAIGTGVRIGRLSWYKDYEVYRLTDKLAILRGDLACAKYSRFGRSSYDFILFAKTLAGVLRAESGILFKEHHLRKVHCAELPYAQDDEFVCTELAYEVTYLQGAPILSPKVVSLPPAIQEVINEGKQLRKVEK